MKKIEKQLFNLCSFINECYPSFFTLFLFMLFFFIALVIHKYRKKDSEDIEEQKLFDKFFNRSDRYIFDETTECSNNLN